MRISCLNQSNQFLPCCYSRYLSQVHQRRVSRTVCGGKVSSPTVYDERLYLYFC